MSSRKICDILEKSVELDRLRKDQQEVLLEINKMHEKLRDTPEVVEKPGDSSLAKLKGLYIEAKDLSETEVTVYDQLLNQLEVLLPSARPGQQRRRIEGNDRKRKRMKNDFDISGLSPSIRNQLDACASLKGEQVAARVSVENADKDEWFVVKVMHFDRETKE